MKKLQDDQLIRVARALIGIDQQDLAKQLGVSKSYICKIEKGEREPNDVVKKWAKETIKKYV